MEDRLTKLEELYSVQTHTIGQMSTEMFQQQQEITVLKLQLKALEDQLESMDAAGEIGGQERPPHY